MDCWKILNISPESDVLTIETTYNNLVMDMDRNKEEYIVIKKAYDEAIDYYFKHAFDSTMENNYENSYSEYDDHGSVEEFLYDADISSTKPYVEESLNERAETKKKNYYPSTEKNKNKPFKLGKVIAGLWLVIIPVWNLVYDFIEDKISYNDYSFNDEVGQDIVSIYNSDEFIEAEYDTRMNLTLEDIKQTNYYKLNREFNGKIIVSETIIRDNNLEEYMESPIYIGKLNTSILLFSDKDFSNENTEFDFDGVKTSIEKDTFDEIMNSCEYEENANWIYCGYVDTSSQAFDKAYDNELSIYMDSDGIEKKDIYSDNEFENSKFSGPHSMYLTDIIPLDMYLIKSNDNYILENKEYIEANHIDVESYMQMYCGILENYRVGFVDPNFSMDYLNEEDNGCYVEGSRYYLAADELTEVKVEEGYDLNKVEIFKCFLEKDY